MADLQVTEKHIYLAVFNADSAKFVFHFHEPLNVQHNEQYLLILKECLLPRVQVVLPEGYVVLNERVKHRIPLLYVSTPTDVIDQLNATLGEEFTPLRYLSKEVDRYGVNATRLTLLPKQSIRVSENYASLLFEGKSHLINKSESENFVRDFKVQKNYEENTYYLTCDLVEETSVNDRQLPLVGTLVVRYRSRETQAKLMWETEDTQGKTFLKTGSHRQITFGIRDEKGEFVRPKGGLFFLHVKLCT